MKDLKVTNDNESINIGGKYAIRMDYYQYKLDELKKNSKTGETYIAHTTYHGNLESLLKKINDLEIKCKKSTMKDLKDFTITIKESTKLINNIGNQLEKTCMKKLRLLQK